MAIEDIAPVPFRTGSGAPAIAGERAGEGSPVILLHGLTATRRYVVHGSKVLPRRGHRLVAYDARGHGHSERAPAGGGYTYAEMAADLGRVIDELGEGERVALAGDSMGAHTAVVFALERASAIAALIAIRPASIGVPPPEDVIAEWDRLAAGLESGGVDGFLDAYDRDLDPAWRETLLRITRQRLLEHDDTAALADALRQVPRSLPFEGIAELQSLDVPTLVVASHDDPDAGHPYAVAEAWAESLPQARLVSERAGESPLAWRGGLLSRAIADFLAEPGVVERFA